MEDPSGTEGKSVSIAPWKSEEYFKAIIQNSSDIILVLDKLGIITYASPSVEHVLGFGPDELIGQISLDLIVPDDKPRAIADFAKAMLVKEILIPNVFRIKHKNGTERIFEGVGNNLLDNPIVAGFVMNVRDITDRERAEDKLREREANYRQLFDNAPSSIFQVNFRTGKFIKANEVFCEYLGYSQEEITSLGPHDITTEEGQKLFLERLNIIVSGEKLPEDPEFEIVGRNGKRWWVKLNVKIIYDSEGLFGANVVAHDITERKKAEDKLLRTLESLRIAFGTTVQVMVSAVETRDPYTAGHQIRSADLARAIATEMGLPQEKIEGIRMAGSIHDIGKLSIPAEILAKPTKLTNIEFSLIKEHARKGYEILKDVASPWPLAEIVYQHHERMDGSGYPRKLKGEEILLEARIMAVADVVEAMASYRPYRPAIGIDAALQEIGQNGGILYDKTAADACLKLFREKGFQLGET